MLPTPTRAYLCNGPMDLRRSIDGLALFVETVLERSPLSGEAFVFLNKRLDKVKILWWDRHGFWLAYKRLERGRFRAYPQAREMRWAEFLLLIEGVEPTVRRLPEVACERVN